MIGTPENLLVEISGALGVKESHYLNKRERESKRERGYVYLWNGENTEMVLSP